MTTRHSIRLGGLPLGRLCRSLLLPLLLLLAQHGGLLHELSHYAAPDTQDGSEKQQSHSGPCELCLAFAQLDGASTPETVVVEPPALSFAVPAASPLLDWTAHAPPEQSRGPPVFL